MKTTTLQRLRSLSAIAFCVLLLPPGANAQIPTLQRYVDCSAPASLAIETVRGETLYLDFLYRQTNADFSVEAATNVTLRYRSSDMAANTFYSLAGTATGNLARFLWSPAAQTAATNYQFTLSLGGVPGANLRGYGTLKQLGSVAGTATNSPTVYLPVPIADATFAWSQLTNRPTIWPGSATDTVAQASIAILSTNVPTLAQFVASTNAIDSAFIASKGGVTNEGSAKLSLSSGSIVSGAISRVSFQTTNANEVLIDGGGEGTDIYYKGLGDFYTNTANTYHLQAIITSVRSIIQVRRGPFGGGHVVYIGDTLGVHPAFAWSVVNDGVPPAPSMPNDNGLFCPLQTNIVLDLHALSDSNKASIAVLTTNTVTPSQLVIATNGIDGAFIASKGGLTNASAFATAAQGMKADTALQPADTNGWVVSSHASFVSTNGARMGGALYSDLDYLTTAPTADEIPTAEWVRSLVMQGTEWYFTANVTNGFGERTTNFVALATTTPTALTNSIASPASSSYFVGGITTQLYGEVRSPITFEVWAFRSGPALTLPCHPEIYYVYNGTNNLGDWEAGDQNIAASTTPAKYTWTVSFTEPAITSGVRIIGYLKSGTVVGSGTINILGGGAYNSHMDIEGAAAGQSAGEVAANLSAHTNLTIAGGVHGGLTAAAIGAAGGVTNGQTVTNSLQLGGVAAASYVQYGVKIASATNADSANSATTAVTVTGSQSNIIAVAVTNGVFSSGTVVSNRNGILYIPTNNFGGGSGSGDISNGVGMGAATVTKSNNMLYVSVPDLSGSIATLQATDTSLRNQINKNDRNDILTRLLLQYHAGWNQPDPSMEEGYIEDWGNTNNVGSGSVNYTIETNRIRIGAQTQAQGVSAVLLHMDGANGSTNVTDTIENTTWAVTGAIITNPTSAKFSGCLDLKNTGYASLSTGGSAWNVGTNDFTIDAWVYLYANPAGLWNPRVIRDGVQAFNLMIRDSLEVAWLDGNRQTTSKISLNAWHHLAVVRYNTITTIYINGTNGHSAAEVSSWSPANLVIGCQINEQFPGYIDELRFAKRAVWTSNFVPSNAPYADSVGYWTNGSLRSAPVALSNTPVAVSFVMAHDGAATNIAAKLISGSATNALSLTAVGAYAVSNVNVYGCTTNVTGWTNSLSVILDGTNNVATTNYGYGIQWRFN